MFKLFLLLLAGGVNIAAIVAPFVVALVGLGVTFSLIVIIRLILYKPPPPVTIRFSNKDEPGSLANMLKVFKVS